MDHFRRLLVFLLFFLNTTTTAHYDGFHALVKGWGWQKNDVIQESVSQEQIVQEYLHSPFRAILRPRHDSDLQRCLEIFIQPAIVSHDGRPQAVDLSTFHPFNPPGSSLSPRHFAAGGVSSPWPLIGGAPSCVTSLRLNSVGGWTSLSPFFLSSRVQPRVFSSPFRFSPAPHGALASSLLHSSFSLACVATDPT